jgi:hypothetical protein
MSSVFTGVQPLFFARQILSAMIAPLNQRAIRPGSLNVIGADGSPKGFCRRRSMTLRRGAGVSSFFGRAN